MLLEELARGVAAKELEAPGDGLALELVPQLGVAALLIDETLREGAPGLGVEGRVVQQMAAPWNELIVAKDLLALANGLVKEKYSQSLYNQKR